MNLRFRDFVRPHLPHWRLLIAAALAIGLVSGNKWSAAQTAQAAQAARAVRLHDFGAVCDGATDDSAAIARALAQARKLHVPLLVPEGRCAFGDIIRVDGVAMAGSGEASVLYALDWRRSAIFMSGAGPSLSHLKLSGVAAPERQADWEMTKITIFGATDFVVDGMTIEGAPAASIQTAQRATRGRITNNLIRNSLSDSIHITDGASQVLVENNRIEYSGDDGIAVVSYRNDGARVNNVTARHNVIVGNKFGRNMSVVGGQKIVYENNLLQDNVTAACLYFAQEDSYRTFSALDVTARHNTLKNCGNPAIGHAAVMIYSDGTEANNNIKLQYNDIAQNGQDGIRYFGAQTNVTIEQNRITGARISYVGGTAPGVMVLPYTGAPVGRVAP